MELERIRKHIHKSLWVGGKKRLKKNPKARCQLGNKAMKIKLTTMLRGKKRKKQICKVK